MKRLLQTFSFLILNGAASAQLEGPPAAAPTLGDAVMTAGMSVVGTDSKNWAYVTWKSPGATTLAPDQQFSVYLSPGVGAPFQRQAIVGPSQDLPSVSLLLKRAAALGINPATLDMVLRDLLRKERWGGNVDSQGFSLKTSGFDGKSLEAKLSAVMNRGFASADGMAALQVLAPAHPALRMALGRAWAGVLPAGPGPMMLEIREWKNGADGPVIGRCELQPGQSTALSSPGPIVQVPDLKPKADLSIKIRWAVPNELRRDQLHVQGFRAYRVFRGDAEEAGLALSATPQQIATFLTTHQPIVDLVNEAPVPISKLFSADDVGDFSPPAGDLTTYFIQDDGNKGQPSNEAPNSPRRKGFRSNARYWYCVRAVDLLGREGPPSMLAEGIALRTIPPDVPGNLRIADLPVGPNGDRRMVIKWKQNGPPQGIEDRTTDRYAIYRGFIPEYNSSTLSDLESPSAFRFLEPLGYVTHAAADADGWLEFVDDVAEPTQGNTDRSIWYAVTALHDTPLDVFFTSPHDLVQSAPSAPGFGVFRDREGPPPPSGFVQPNCGKLVAVHALSDTAPRTGVDTFGLVAHIRAIATLRNRSLQGVKFYFINAGTNQVVHESPLLQFGEAETLQYEYAVSALISGNMRVACVGIAPDGCLTIPGSTPDEEMEGETNLFYQKHFYLGRYAATAFDPNGTSDVATRGVPLALSSIFILGPDTLSGVPELSTTLEGQTVLVQGRTPGGFGVGGGLSNGLGPVFVTIGVGQVTNGRVVFRHPGRFLFDGQNHQYRIIALPSGGVCACLHDARPFGLNTIIPLTVGLNIPATTREWRIYRRVDDGDPALVKTGSVDPTGIPPETILAEDKTMPPHGAVVRYYGQCFDQNQNPSAYVFLGKVQLIPEPATPLLNIPEAIVNEVNGTPEVNLSWFCPRPGTKHFRIYVLPLNAGDPPADQISPPSSEYFVPRTFLYSGNGIVLQTSYKLAGEKDFKTVPIISHFDQADLAKGETAVVHKARIAVTPDVPYVIWVAALGLDGSSFVPGLARLFTWKTPAAPAQLDLVGWPARPMPKTITNASVQAFLTKDVIQDTPTFAYMEEFSTIPDETAAGLYPVAVRIGLMPIVPQEIEHDPGDPDCSEHPAAFPYNSNGGTYTFDPTAFVLAEALPAVLYRQTILAGGTVGPLVQVSPLRRSVAFQTESFDPGALGDRRMTIRDPFIKTLTYLVQGVPVPVVHLCLVDTHSVEEGATYRYYLVNYREDGEIRRVFDCGTVTIPESP